jgi:cyanophycinase-like exopeptidase
MKIIPAPGPIILFGSGETSPSGQKVFNELFQQLPARPRCALLETAAGFELNSYQVIEKVGDFLRLRLQNYSPQIEIVRARQRNSAHSPDEPEIVTPLLQAEMIFMGPGSPTYAARQLRNSLAWQMTLARHALGAALVFASAGVIAIGSYVLPVYEIFKAGEDLHWKDGLDFFGNYGLSLVLVPHWNNREGGAELDTSRCFMGKERFERLVEMLPAGQTILGIDENTALLMDLQTGQGKVLGAGEVIWLHVGHIHAGSRDEALPQETGLEGVIAQRGGHVHRYRTGESFPLPECCPMGAVVPGQGLPPWVWEAALRTAALEAVREEDAEDVPPEQVLQLMEERQEARRNKDWGRADDLRGKMAALGWAVEDGKEGVKLKRRE